MKGKYYIGAVLVLLVFGLLTYHFAARIRPSNRAQSGTPESQTNQPAGQAPSRPGTPETAPISTGARSPAPHARITNPGVAFKTVIRPQIPASAKTNQPVPVDLAAKTKSVNAAVLNTNANTQVTTNLMATAWRRTLNWIGTSTRYWPYLLALIALVIAGGVTAFFLARKRSHPDTDLPIPTPSPPPDHVPAPAPLIAKPKRRKAITKLRFNVCNIFYSIHGAHRLWQFNVAGNEVTFNSEQSFSEDEQLPKSLVAKNFQSIWRPRLNVAWLPIDQVFLRVIHLPTTDWTELVSMVELQLEKLSPLPVNQMVWGVDVVPKPSETTTTVIVTIASRNLVEDFLGRLEGRGFFTDRLEIPQLHQLLDTPMEQDGVWLFPSKLGTMTTCLVAWHCGGILQNINLIRITQDEHWPDAFLSQLSQVAWAGEMEGWLTAMPPCHLVADATTIQQWQPVLDQWSPHPVETTPSLEDRQLANLNTRHLARTEIQANLLPAEYATRYRQHFVDRLWIGGFGALAAIYLVWLLIYFAVVQVFIFQRNRVTAQVGALKPKYTAAMESKARIQVLQDQINLKYAALECWKAAAELLPVGLTLTDLSLLQGKTLTIHGTAPADQVELVLDYNRLLSQYRVNGTNGPLFFSLVKPYSTQVRPGPGGVQIAHWDFPCELRQQY